MRRIGQHERSLVIGAHQYICSGRADDCARVVANDHRNVDVLRRQIRDRYTQYGAAGVVKGQQIGTRIARFQWHDGFLLRLNLVEDRKSVYGAGGGQSCRAQQHRRSLRTRTVENQRSVRGQRSVKRGGEQRPSSRRKLRESHRQQKSAVEAGVKDRGEKTHPRLRLSRALIDQREHRRPILFGREMRHGANEVQAGNNVRFLFDGERLPLDRERSGPIASPVVAY